MQMFELMLVNLQIVIYIARAEVIVQCVHLLITLLLGSIEVENKHYSIGPSNQLFSIGLKDGA